MVKIIFIEDFTEWPGGRSRKVSDGSAEEFYEDVLQPKYKEAKDKNVQLSIDLDGADGYAGSFIDEAFGRLGHEFGLDDIKNRLIIITTEQPHLEETIFDSVAEWAKDGIHYNSALAEGIELKESNYFSSVKNKEK